MSLNSSMQICAANHKVLVDRHHNEVWVVIVDGNQRITMNPMHVRALAAALDAFEAAEAAPALEAAE